MDPVVDRVVARFRLAYRVAARYVAASYFKLNDFVYYGKYKNHVGRVIGFGKDKWGNPTIIIEPVPKGRKQNKEFGLFRIWRKDVKDNAKALLEQAAAEQGQQPPV